MMTSISGVSVESVRPLAAAERAAGVPEAGQTDETAPRKPVMDEYVQSKPEEASGRYWLGRDENGQPKIYFDSPDHGTDAPEIEKPDQGAESSGEREERYLGSTDQVDREIEQLKREKAELEQRLNAETDEARREDLERQLAQTERELKRKDNDTYRRQHTQVTKLS